MLRNKLRLYLLNSQSGLKNAIQEIEDDCCNFNGDRIVTREGIPNLNVGGVKLKEFIENYFFPPIPPALFITVIPSIKEYGDFARAAVHWSVTKKNKGVIQIQIDNQDLAPDYPDEQINEDIDPLDASNTGNLLMPVYLPDNATEYQFFLYVKDTLNNLFSASATLSFLHRRIWLATGEDIMSMDATVLSEYLNTAIATTETPPNIVNSELATTRIQERTITCTNEYLCFLWPADFGGDSNDFIVNNFDVNLWQIKDITYVNIFGFEWPFRLVQSWHKLYGTYQIQVTNDVGLNPIP